VDRRQRAAQVLPDGAHLVGSEGPPLDQQRFQRASLDELGPDADLIADALGTVDGEHVRVSHTGQQPRFIDRRRR
jgi:hypothetical protein